MLAVQNTVLKSACNITKDLSIFLTVAVEHQT